MSLPVRSKFRCFRIIGGLLALLAGTLLCGCSAVKLGYNNAPQLSYWWLDNYLDFTDAQSARVRADLQALQAWHRQNELPIYISSLEKLQRLAPSRLSPEQVCGLFSEFKTRLQTLLDQTEPTLLALAPTLEPDQFDHLARKFEKRNLKWREEWLDGTPSQRQERRFKLMRERAEMLYGRLDEAQLSLLRSSVASSVFDAAASYREMQRRQQDALQTLRLLQTGTLPERRAHAQAHALLARTLQSPDAAYQHDMEELTQEGCKTFSSLHNSTTPAQRQQALETLKDYEMDARTLMTMNTGPSR